MIAVIIRSATTIRPWPVVIGLILSLSFAALLLLYPSAVFHVIPEWMCGNTHTRLQWKVAHTEQFEGNKKRLYIIGGSQVVQGFPCERDLALLADEYVPDFHVMEAAYSGQSMLETLILLSHLPVDESTYVFVQASPYRLMGDSRKMDQCRLLLDPSKALEILAAKGYQLEDSVRENRIVTQLTILATRSFRPLNKLLTEKRYLSDPVGFVAERVSSGAKKAVTVAKDDTPILTEVEILRIVASYVRSRGGHIYLFGMPYNEQFPLGMPGWAPDEHVNPAVRQWLKRMRRPGRAAGVAGRYDDDYRTLIGKSCIPYYRIIDNNAFEPTDYYDSVHLMEPGRAKFLPEFFRVVRRVVGDSESPMQNCGE